MVPIAIILLFVIETNCQSMSTPYLHFLGQNLSNNSYVDISLIGMSTDGSDSAQCRSELSDCCNVQPFIGDWYRPNGTRLPFPEPPGVYFARNIQSVDIRRSNNTNSPTGIYRCDIVFNSSNPSLRTSLYIGLYTSNKGDISISDDVRLTVVSDLNGESPQFTLTCTSTGGPATTVTWTRDSTILTEGTVTVLDDPVTANYTHTLTVTGRLPGLYNCTVENNRPSTVTSYFTVQEASPPSDLCYTTVEDYSMLENYTSVLLTWTPPTPLGYTTGYRISFTGGGNNDVTDVSGGSTDNYTLTGLRRGEQYNISIIALSQHFFSQIVFWDPIMIPTETPVNERDCHCENNYTNSTFSNPNGDHEITCEPGKTESCTEALLVATIAPSILVIIIVIQFVIILTFVLKRRAPKISQPRLECSSGIYEEIKEIKRVSASFSVQGSGGAYDHIVLSNSHN